MELNPKNKTTLYYILKFCLKIHWVGFALKNRASNMFNISAQILVNDKSMWQMTLVYQSVMFFTPSAVFNPN